MWEKDKPEAEASRANAAPLPASSSVRTATSQYRSPEQNRGTTIGEAMSIIGDIYSEEDLLINGKVRGRLDVKENRLVVGPSGNAESDITAREVVILGSVRGDIETSSKITIRNQGSLVGNIRTSGIVIDDAAYFKGSIDIIRKPSEPA
jgi:cytoskeletal protein CcmA (bactofilin family)